MSEFLGAWDQIHGMAGMLAMRQLLALLDGTGQGVDAHTLQLIRHVNGNPPAKGWQRWHLSRALAVALTELREIREGQESYWVVN